MVKSYTSHQEAGIPTEEDLKLINKYALRPLKKEEVFVFSVILCDNDIDRDFERFSKSSLYALEKLFVGKTGIFNHSMQSEDQTARTFRTQVITDEDKNTCDGLPYTYLKAWCYTVRSDKNNSLIRDIESGIKKEVSVSCNASKKTCSVCGESLCTHIQGRKYNGKMCYKTLEGITDAYEWSFVAVPAQKNAGVTKSAGSYKKEKNMENILKSIKEQKSVTLEGDELKKLYGYISSLQKDSADGKRYRESLLENAKKGFAISFPEIEEDCVDAILCGVSSNHLEKLCDALCKQASKVIPTVSQFGTHKTEQQSQANQQFKF